MAQDFRKTIPAAIFHRNQTIRPAKTHVIDMDFVETHGVVAIARNEPELASGNEFLRHVDFFELVRRDNTDCLHVVTTEDNNVGIGNVAKMLNRTNDARIGRRLFRDDESILFDTFVGIRDCRDVDIFLKTHNAGDVLVHKSFVVG